MLVKQVSIEKLHDEGRKLEPGFVGEYADKKNMPQDQMTLMFLKQLLRPKENQALQYMEQFPFKKQDIIDLAKEATLAVTSQPTVISDIKSPVKIFGNLHGNFIDLMRFFDIWNHPSESGDIENYAYIFLGNFVDRGKFSLETICLLMALKITYSDHVFLIRGNHEDPQVNKHMGFGQECKERLGEDINAPGSVFNTINNFFENLPLAAIISDGKSGNKVFCCHGGIGTNSMKVEDIKALKRPLKVSFDQATAE